MDYEVPKYSMEGQLFVVKKKEYKDLEKICRLVVMTDCVDFFMNLIWLIWFDLELVS